MWPFYETTKNLYMDRQYYMFTMTWRHTDWLCAMIIDIDLYWDYYPTCWIWNIATQCRCQLRNLHVYLLVYFYDYFGVFLCFWFRFFFNLRFTHSIFISTCRLYICSYECFSSLLNLKWEIMSQKSSWIRLKVSLYTCTCRVFFILLNI